MILDAKPFDDLTISFIRCVHKKNKKIEGFAGLRVAQVEIERRLDGSHWLRFGAASSACPLVQRPRRAGTAATRYRGQFGAQDQVRRHSRHSGSGLRRIGASLSEWGRLFQVGAM